MGTNDERAANQALIAMRRKKKSQQIDVVSKQVFSDFTCAMINYEHTSS